MREGKGEREKSFIKKTLLIDLYTLISIGIAQLQNFFLPPLQAHVLAATLVGLWRLRVMDGQIPSPYTR